MTIYSLQLNMSDLINFQKIQWSQPNYQADTMFSVNASARNKECYCSASKAYQFLRKKIQGGKFVTRGI